MNNESIQRLREPAAWALLGAVAAILLGALIYVFGGSSFGDDTSTRFAGIGTTVVGPGTVALILAAVALVLTGPNRSPRTFGIVMMAMIELGIGALFGVISLIMGFVAYGDYSLANAFQHFFTIGAYLTVVVFAGLFLIRVFGDPNLVPRSAAPAYPATGAQPAFGQQQPGYVTGAQPGATQTGTWQQGADAYAQAGTAQGEAQQAASGYDQSAYGQQYQQAGYTAGDSEATLVQPAVSDSSGGSYAAGEDARSEERAAQEAIQHGWSQPATGVADSQSGGNQPYADPGQYGTGGYAAPSSPSEGYPADQQRSGTETGDPWSGQYRDDNRS